MSGLAWRPTRAELADLEAEHRTRVHGLDRLVSVPDLLGEGAGTADVLAVRLPDGSRAAGVVAVTDVGPASPGATARALREHRLRARAAGPDVTAATAALLDAWVDRARRGADPEPAGPPPADDVAPALRPVPAAHGLAVAWPSRDTEAVAALAGRGMYPAVHLAARQHARPSDGGASPPAGVVLRDATVADVAAVVEHQLAELAYDELVGAARVRAAARGSMTPLVAAAVSREDSVVLVAVPDGGRPTTPADGPRHVPDEVLGVVAVEPPQRSSWVAGAVDRGPVAYVVLLHVSPRARGAALGAALVGAALARVRELSGPDTVVLLHHGVLNPLSAPFWARHGFRPVLTTWELPVTRTP